MDIKEKIEKKIWALLQKTEANGATKAEALSAMRKAKELCDTYAISISSVKNPMQGETLTVGEIEVFDSGYDFTLTLYWLSKYFDVKILLNTGIKTITVYGYQTDIDLFGYFYEFTCKSCLSDLDKFRKTHDYKVLRSRGTHGRTISANFIKGYCVEVSNKLKANYNDRKEERSESTALVLVEKEKQVQSFYKNETSNQRLGTHRASRPNNSGGYQDGKKRGKNLSLTQGIN